MARIERWLTVGGLLVALSVAGMAPAGASIDASGQWFLQSLFFPGSVLSETWTQVGSVLTTDDGWTGTINPNTGVFSMSKPSDPICDPCPTCCIVCQDATRTGTVAPDAMTFAASESDPFGTMCHEATSPLVGSRYECGNGIVDPAEQCDDGNYTSGDGCDPFCHVEPCYVCAGQPSTCAPAPSGSACDGGAPCTVTACDGSGSCQVTGATNCDDGSTCTLDACTAPSGCTHAPDVRSCRTGKSSLLVATSTHPDKDKAVWKWIGASTSADELADPRTDATYTLCLFAGSSAAVIGQAVISPDPLKWSPIDDKGFRYKDPTASTAGMRSITLKSSPADRARIVLNGKGAGLSFDPPPAALPVIAQLINSHSNVCWSATYDATTIVDNRAGLLKAKLR